MRIPMLSEPVRRDISRAKVLETSGVAAAARKTNGGASCTCPCCIISGGILWCC